MPERAAAAALCAAALAGGALAALACRHHSWRLRTRRACWLQTTLLETIPLTRAMEVLVEQESNDDSGLTLSVPLAPNANIHGTAFAGSLHSLAVLAAWGWLQLHANRHAGSLRASTIVVRRTEVAYKAPVKAAFAATAEAPTAADLQRCVSRPAWRAVKRSDNSALTTASTPTLTRTRRQRSRCASQSRRSVDTKAASPLSS